MFLREANWKLHTEVFSLHTLTKSRCPGLWEILVSLCADITQISLGTDAQQYMKSELGSAYIEVPDYLFLWFSKKGALLMTGMGTSCLIKSLTVLFGNSLSLWTSLFSSLIHNCGYLVCSSILSVGLQVYCLLPKRELLNVSSSYSFTVLRLANPHSGEIQLFLMHYLEYSVLNFWALWGRIQKYKMCCVSFPDRSTEVGPSVHIPSFSSTPLPANGHAHSLRTT